MGTTNNIKEILHSEEIIKRTCAICSQPLTSDNYQVLYRNNHDIGWGYRLKEGDSRGWITIEIQLEHEICPTK